MRRLGWILCTLYTAITIGTVIGQVSQPGGGANFPSASAAGQVIVSNAAGQTYVAGSLTAGPYGNGFLYRVPIDINVGQVSGSLDLPNYTALLSGTYTPFASVANGGVMQSANGYDVLFSSDAAGQNVLGYDLDSYNVTGAVIYHVKIPNVSHTINTRYYAFLGNPNIYYFIGGVAGAAWDNNYVMVQHLPNGTTLTANDTSFGHNNGTLVNTPTAVAGKIDGAANFVAASSQYINVGNGSSVQITGNITLESWVNLSSMPTTANFRYFIGKGYDGSEAYSLRLFNPSGTVQLQAGSNDGVTNFGANWNISGWSTGQWHHVVGTYDGTNWNVYFDGANVNATAGAKGAVSSTKSVVIGGTDISGTVQRFMDGIIDEARISNVARSAGWIATQYNNHNAPGSFHTVGTVTFTAPAAMPNQIPYTTLFVSKIPGFVNDNCHFALTLATTGCTTNNTAVINAAVSSNSGHPLKLIYDVFTIQGGLQLPTGGNIEVEGIMGGGFVAPSNCDCSLISNTAGGVPYRVIDVGGGAPAIGTAGNVYIHGMLINGNRGTYVSPGSASNGNVSGNLPAGGAGGNAHSWGYDNTFVWMLGIDLWTLNNIRVEGNYLYDVPAYGIHITNANNVIVSKNRIEAASFDLFHHQDGVHISGSTTQVDIGGNLLIALGDDGVAINAPEGYLGNIGDVIVHDNRFSNTLSCIRAYGGSSGPYTIGNVISSGNACSLNASGYAYFIGETGTAAGVDYIGSWKSVNNTFTGPLVDKMTNSGVRDLSHTGDTWFPTAAGPWGTFATGDTISNYSFSNTTIYRQSNIATYLLQMANSATVKRLSVNGLNITDSGSYTAIPQLVSIPAGGTISDMNLVGVTWSNITAPVDTFTGLTSYRMVNGPPVPTANLPTCNAAMSGAMLSVSDAAATPVYNATVAGGGTIRLPVLCDGNLSLWKNH